MIKYTIYEKARIVGARALQIAMGAPLLLNLNDDDLEKLKYNPITIARMEFDQEVIPITIRRPLPKQQVA